MTNKFKINEVDFDKNNTENVLCLSIKKLDDGSGEIRRFHHLLYKIVSNADNFGHHDSKKIFKHVFGKQLKVIQCRHRNWIWSFSNDKAVIYVLISSEGPALEYNKELSDANAVHQLFEEVFDVVGEAIITNYKNKKNYLAYSKENTKNRMEEGENVN